MAAAKPIQESSKRVTEEEFMRLPQDGKYELVDGEVRKVPANHIHDIIGARLILRRKPCAAYSQEATMCACRCRWRRQNGVCPSRILPSYRIPLRLCEAASENGHVHRRSGGYHP